MENGNTLNNLRTDTGYNGLSGDKITVVYKVPPYCHPNKRPIQTVGGTTTQGNSVSMLEERVQHMSGVQTILQHTQNNVHSPQQHPLYGSPSKVHPQKMVLQLHRDPKTGNLMMLNNVRPHNIIQMENQPPGSSSPGQMPSSASGQPQGQVPGQSQGQLPPGQVTSQQVANHGYHPGRHLHHQLQLKHLPQGGGQAVTQLTHNVHQAPQIIQPRPQQQQQQQLQTTQPNYENITYTRTYPQTSQQSYQYTSYPPSLRPVTRYVTPQYQQMLVQNHLRLASQQQQQQQQSVTTQVLASQPRYPYQNHVVSNSRAVTTERLSHFDYGEQDEVSNNQGFNRTSAYQQVIENEDKSTLRVTQSTPSSSCNPVYVGPQPAQIIGQLRPTQTFVSQPNIISTQSSSQFRAAAHQQPYVIRNQIRSSVPVPQTSVLPSRPPNVVASPAHSTSTEYSSVRPVILTAQQAGQTFHSSPVVVQINGGKSIRGSIVSLNPQPKQISPAPNSTHVYFTIPQGNSAAKFIKCPNGHLKPLNGVAVQNSLSQSKMYTVRYVTPKSEDGKSKQYFTIYSPIAPSNNTVKILTAPVSKSTEKVILPKSTPSTPEQARKRKLTPTKVSTPQPSKLTRIEPKPTQTSTQHNELIQRVSKSLDGDREAVQNPDCNTPFESFPDAFRKLMKYHIFFEPDTKESYLKRVDKLHEEISQKLINRKDNLFNKYYSRFLEDSARPMPRYYESSDMVSLLQQRLLDDKEELQKAKEDLEKVKEELEKAKEDKAREEQRASENVSPNPEGHID